MRLTATAFRFFTGKNLWMLSLLLLSAWSASAQYIPGQIVRKATLSSTDAILNPNGDQFVSKTVYGYPGSDDVSSSVNEIAYKPVYPFYSEPNSDLRRGPNTRFSDYVPSTVDKASYYMYYDNSVPGSERLLLRVRMGAIIPGAKGFSFLFDTDSKFGSSGTYADPNYVAATTGIGGNPGFELELDLFTQNATSSTGIALYNIDGKDKRGNFTQLYSVNNWVDYSQISMASTTDAGDPDFYIDFWIPFSALGITTSTPLRIIPTTVMAPLPAIGGPKSDIYGLPDGYYGNYMDEYVNMVVGTPSYTITQFTSGGTGMPSSLACTAPATLDKISSQASTSTQTITGSWTPLNLFTDNTGVTKASLTSKVSLYKVGTATVIASTFVTTTTNTSVKFSFSGVSVTTGDQFYVKTQGYTAANGTANESECYQSNTVTAAVQCNPANRPSALVLTCTSGNKGTGGTTKPSLMPTSTVWVTNTVSGTTDNQSTNAGSINSQLFTPAESGTAPNVTWSYSAGCSAQSNILEGNYKFWLVDANNCASDPVFYCANVSNRLASGTPLTAPVITTTNITASTTSISGTAQSGTTITLYLNGVAQTPVTTSGAFNTATTGTWTVSGLTLTADDKIMVTAERNGGTAATTYCGNVSTSTTVGCTVEAPLPATDSNTGWLTVSSGVVSGTSSLIGGTVTMYNSSNASVGTGTVSSSGAWSITPSPVVSSGATYTFQVASGTCSSPLSSSYTYNNTQATCGTALISSYTTTSPFVTSPVTNSSNSSSITVDPFATSITVTLPTSSSARYVTLYETNSVSLTSNLTAISTVLVAANATSVTFGSVSSGNLGLYTNSSTPSLVLGIQNYNTVTSTYTSVETVCGTAIGTVPCPVSSLAQPSLAVVSTCPTCTAGLGTTTVTLPAGNSITVSLTNAVVGMSYVLREKNTTNSYSNVYTATGTTLTIPTKAISSSVILEAVGTIIYTSSDGVVTSCQVTSANSVTANVTATTNVYLAGTVFDDVNGGNMDGTAVSSVTNASSVSTPLYAYVLNSSNIPQGTASGGNIAGTAISTGAGGTSLGTYSYNLTTLLGTTYGTYKVILSTSSTLPAASAATASKPTGWSNIAEGLSGGAGDGTADGVYTFTYSSNSTSTGGTTQAVDFAIDGIPTAANGTVPSQVNPGGTTSVTVTSTQFSGTDPRDVANGGIAYVHLTSFPTNATSFTVTGATSPGGKTSTITYYTPTTLPSSCSNCALWSTVSSTGLYVATNSNGSLVNTSAVQVDPVNGPVTVTMNYTTIDAAGIESTASGASAATMTLTFTDLTLSGNVYHDANALTDGAITTTTAIGQITNNGANVQLYMNLVDASTSNVLATATVNTTTGAYSFGTADGIVKGGSYTLVLSTTQGTVGSAAPSAVLSSTTPGWVFTGEGNTSAGDGTPNGSYSSGTLNTSDVVNFAVNAKPLVTNNTITGGVNPGGTSTYSVASSAFLTSDVTPGSVSSIKLTSFPTSTTSFTVSGTTYYATGATLPGGCATCANFPAAGLTLTYSSGSLPAIALDPVSGAVSPVFTYTATDNGGQVSNSGTLTINFSTLAISGTVYNDYDGLSNNAIDKIATNGGQTLYVNAFSGATLIGSSVVASNGTYSISGFDNGTYSLVLSTTNGSSTASLPSGFVNTGEGTGTASDGTVNGTTPVTLSGTAATTINFGYDRTATADTKSYVMGPNTNPAISTVSVTSTSSSTVYVASIALSGTASSGSTPGVLTGSDPDGSTGATLALTQQTSNVSLVIDPAQYSGTRHGQSYTDAVMLRYNGVQLQANGCAGSDIGKTACAYYNPAIKVWEIPSYDLTKLTLLVRNGTSGFSFKYAWKDAADMTGSQAAYSISFEQPLPVHLLSFTGEKRANIGALSWTAANEQSFRGYGVERSTDGRSFTEVGFVNGRNSANTEQYNYNDDLSALSGAFVYYRLRLVDLNGSFTYSSVVRLSLSGNAVSGVQVLGNPVRTSALRLQLVSDATTVARIQVSDAAGRVVTTRSQVISSGTTVLQVELPAGLSKGTYTVYTLLGDERFSSQVLLDR